MNTRQRIKSMTTSELAHEEIRFMSVQAIRYVNGERIGKYDEVESMLFDIKKLLESKGKKPPKR